VRVGIPKLPNDHAARGGVAEPAVLCLLKPSCLIMATERARVHIRAPVVVPPPRLPPTPEARDGYGFPEVVPHPACEIACCGGPTAKLRPDFCK
jgi:hypothetical protein